MESLFSFFASVFGLVITILFLCWLYSRVTLGVCHNTNGMRGKTVIVTGANTGIGKETALELAKRGARVIMASRDTGKSNRVKDFIVASTGNSEVVVMKLDLSCLRSVRDFAKEVNQTERQLDVLVHNAAVFYVFKEGRTVDGLGETMATNLFGPFLLTHLLIDLLRRSAPSRVLVVSSSAYRVATVRVEDIDSPAALPAYQYYSSKVANILFAGELARRLRGSGVTVNCLHPGLIDSDIWKNVPIPLSWLIYIIIKTFAKTNKEGAQTSIYLATSDEVKKLNGKYFKDCKESKLTSDVLNEDLALALWIECEKKVGLTDADPRINKNIN